MSGSSRRSHAWLRKGKREPGEPFLPKVGELYRLNTIVYTLGADPGAARPAVVILTPADPGSRFPIQLVTRTSQLVTRTGKPMPGVKHPKDLTLQLDKDGVFSTFVSVEQQLWQPENVELLGVLPDPFLSDVMRRFT